MLRSGKNFRVCFVEINERVFEVGHLYLTEHGAEAKEEVAHAVTDMQNVMVGVLYAKRRAGGWVADLGGMGWLLAGGARCRTLS